MGLGSSEEPVNRPRNALQVHGPAAFFWPSGAYLNGLYVNPVAPIEAPRDFPENEPAIAPFFVIGNGVQRAGPTASRDGKKAGGTGHKSEPQRSVHSELLKDCRPLCPAARSFEPPKHQIPTGRQHVPNRR